MRSSIKLNLYWLDSKSNVVIVGRARFTEWSWLVWGSRRPVVCDTLRPWRSSTMPSHPSLRAASRIKLQSSSSSFVWLNSVAAKWNLCTVPPVRANCNDFAGNRRRTSNDYQLPWLCNRRRRSGRPHTRLHRRKATGAADYRIPHNFCSIFRT